MKLILAFVATFLTVGLLAGESKSDGGEGGGWKTPPHVLVLHKGDPMPPAGVSYSYDSEETRADFDRRREEDNQKQQAMTEQKETVHIIHLETKTVSCRKSGG